MNRRLALRTLASLPLLATAMPGTAITPTRRRLGFLQPGPRGRVIEEFAAVMGPRLAELGWVEGKTLDMVFRFGEADESRFAVLAKELVDARPDVIGTVGTPCTRALQQVTRTIPIVTSVGDPVAAGFAQSLSRPGGNITGISQGSSEIVPKQLELLRAAVPKLSTLVILRAKTPAFEEITGPVMTAARAAGFIARPYPISSMADVENAFRAVPSGGRGAAYIMHVLPQPDYHAIMQIALRLRVPTVATDDELVEAGGLLHYTLVHEDEDRRTALVVDKLFRGADPAVLPFELPQRTIFVINRRTAAAIGVVFPSDFAIRATRVIG